MWSDDLSKQAPKSSYDKWDWECHHIEKLSFLFDEDDDKAQKLFPTGPVGMEAEGRLSPRDNFHPEKRNTNLFPPRFSNCIPRVTKSKIRGLKYLKPWTISAYKYST